MKNEILAYVRQLPRSTVFWLLALLYVAGTAMLGAIPTYFFHKEWSEWWQWCLVVAWADATLLISGMGEFLADVTKLTMRPFVWIARKVWQLRKSSLVA